MKTTIKDGKLIIELPLNATPQQSKSGKSRIVASTGGFTASTVQVEGRPVKIAVNAII